MSAFADLDPTIARVLAFLQQIGLEIELVEVLDESFVPGIALRRNGLRVCPAELSYPGDLLHEAGHLAVMLPEQRLQEAPQPTDAGEEVATLAWSYAACLHLGLPSSFVFHDDGYKNGAASLRENFDQGRYLGVPLLQWMGLTTDPQGQQASEGTPYPAMKAWLRA